MGTNTVGMDPIRVLHVDDESRFSDMVATFLERECERIEVRSVTTAEEGLEILSAGEVDCIVSDYEMPGMNGIEFLEAVREAFPEFPFVLYTGKGSEEIAAEAIAGGVTDYLQKGSGTEQYAILANRIKNAVSARRIAADAERKATRLEQVLKTVPSCVVRLDYEGRFLFANDRAVEVLGLEETDLTDRAYNDPDWEITDLEGNPIPEEQLPFRQVRDSGEPVYGFRHTVKWPDGSRRILSVNGAPLFDSHGAVEGVVFSLTDITDWWESEELLQQTTARLEALFENSPDMTSVHDETGTILDLNSHLCEMTGYDEDELTGMKVWDIDQTIAPAEVRAIWAEMEYGDRKRFESTFQRSDGTEFPVEVHTRRLDLDGESRFMAMIRDVTERREYERELEETERWLRAILKNTTRPMFMKNRAGEYIFVNREYRKLFGLGDEKVEGLTDHDIHPPGMADSVWNTDRAVIDRGDPIETEERIIVDGEERVFLTSKAPITDIGARPGTGEPIAVFGVATDISERKERERELQRKNEKLEKFANVISHDLRNPLDVAKGRLELVQQESDSEHLDPIDTALERMERIIDDVLRLAREGEDIGETEQIGLQEKVEGAWAIASDGSETAALRVGDVGSNDVPAIEADDTRFQQLLENLFQNAVKHGGEGVTVRVGKLPDGFYIEDDGPGIPEANRKAVLEAGYSTSDDGTGFGLSIVTEVVEAHGWEMDVIEGPEGGARFEITGVDFVAEQ